MPALILISYLSLLVLGLIDNIRGPYFPDVLNELSLNGTVGSWFFAMTSLFAFLGSLTSHWVLQRVSSFKLLLIASLVLGFGFGLCGMAPNLLLLLICCALFGWAFGALNVAQNLLVFEVSPTHLRRRFFSGLHAMYGLSALIAPLVATGFRRLSIEWRGAFLILAVLPIVLSGWAALQKSAPNKLRSKEVPVKFVFSDWSKCFWFILMMAGYLWGELSISTRMVIWLRNDRAFSPDQADFYLAAFFLVLFLGRMVFSLMHIKFLSNATLLWVSALLGALTYYLGLTGSPVWVVICGLALSPFYPIAMEHISSSFVGKSSQALSLIIGFGSASVVLMHLTLGWLSDHVGFTRAMQVGPITLLVIGVVLFAIECVKKVRSGRLEL